MTDSMLLEGNKLCLRVDGVTVDQVFDLHIEAIKFQTENRKT